ncbi:MAG: hypothetical protein ACRENL_04370 [Candidatus Dormibacteria bacterium]
MASTRRRDWRVAAALSVVPGGGQLYNGQSGKARYYFMWAVGCLGADVLFFLGGSALGRQWIADGRLVLAMVFGMFAILVFIGLLVYGLFIWGSAVVDAAAGAREIAGGAEPSRKLRYFHL